MGGIDSFLDGKRSRAAKFEELARGKTKEQRRELEKTLLKPQVLPEYSGNIPGKSSIENRTVKIIFETSMDLELFKRHFKVSAYKELNVRDILLLIKFLSLLDEHILEYDSKEGTLFVIGETGEKTFLG